MALNKDRSGRLHGQILYQRDYPLPAGGRVYLGGLYSFDMNGQLVRAADDDAAQDGKVIVMALESVDNNGGQDGGRKARCMVRGLAVLPAGPLTNAEAGKTVHAIDDDTLSLTANNDRRVGTLVAVDGALAEVIL